MNDPMWTARCTCGWETSLMNGEALEAHAYMHLNGPKAVGKMPCDDKKASVVIGRTMHRGDK